MTKHPGEPTKGNMNSEVTKAVTGLFGWGKFISPGKEVTWAHSWRLFVAIETSLVERWAN